MPIDKGSVVWGILLSVMVNGLYEAIKSFMEGKIFEETTAFLATVIVSAVIMVTFRNLLFPKET